MFCRGITSPNGVCLSFEDELQKTDGLLEVFKKTTLRYVPDKMRLSSESLLNITLRYTSRFSYRIYLKNNAELYQREIIKTHMREKRLVNKLVNVSLLP